MTATGSGTRPSRPVAATQRPSIFDHTDMRLFCRDMLAWLRAHEPTFSVRKACLSLRRCSPSLVTLYLKGERQMSLDRVSDLSRLLRLTGRESRYLATSLSETWARPRGQHHPGGNTFGRPEVQGVTFGRKREPDPDNSIVSQWLHMYVKDSARLRGFRPEPATVQRLLGGLASTRAIGRSLRFLFRQGYLRHTVDGRIVENNALDETTDEIPSRHIRQVHKRALELARACLDSVPTGQREASVLLLPLTQKHFLELKDIVKRWSEEGAAFAEAHASDDERLYQLVINLSPVGGATDTPKGAK